MKQPTPIRGADLAVARLVLGHSIISAWWIIGPTHARALEDQSWPTSS